MVVLFVPENNAISGNPQEVVWKVARNIKRFVLMKKVLFCRKKGVKLKKKHENYSKTNSGKKLRIPNLDVENCSQKVNELVNFELFRLHNLSLKISNSWELRKID